MVADPPDFTIRLFSTIRTRLMERLWAGEGIGGDILWQKNLQKI